MVDPDDVALSLTRQCRLVSITRSSFYYEGKDESLFNVHQATNTAAVVVSSTAPQPITNQILVIVSSLQQNARRREV